MHQEAKCRCSLNEWKNDSTYDFSLTATAATLIFISGRGLAISSDKEGKSGSIYNLVNS